MSDQILLHSGFQVQKSFFENVRLTVEEVVPAMQPNVQYTAEMLCGDEFWGSLTRGERIMAGRCLAELAIKKLLPLAFAKPGGNCSKRYRLI